MTFDMIFFLSKQAKPLQIVSIHKQNHKRILFLAVYKPI
jgi:hypothetical protein